jgi:hypothetical protein
MSWIVRVYAAALVLSVGVATAQTQQKPHVLFVVADDLGRNDLGHFNHIAETPTIDSLLESGIFLESYCECMAWCWPTSVPCRPAVPSIHACVRARANCNGVVRHLHAHVRVGWVGVRTFAVVCLLHDVDTESQEDCRLHLTRPPTRPNTHPPPLTRTHPLSHSPNHPRSLYFLAHPHC